MRISFPKEEALVNKQTTTSVVLVVVVVEKDACVFKRNMHKYVKN